MSRPTASADVFRAIADPTRRAILTRLRQGPSHVNALASEFEQSRPAISKHLRILQDAGIVTGRRSGREHIIALQPETLREVDHWLLEFRALWQTNLNQLKAYLEQE
ncbi:MAG TPA: metalloregulator ArsR/SmtB family transcription factor [Devosiaceae bacterium]|jgi:DNA-binding transcriptional ArsR family regulator